MTLISTLITRDYTVHSTDSLLTRKNDKGERDIIEYKRSKIIKIEAFKGAMSFWGLTKFQVNSKETDIYDFLMEQRKISNQCNSAEDFASILATNMNSEFSKLYFENPIDKGIGIHFTAYEHINDYWIPELFLISNFKDTSYTTLRINGCGASRETRDPASEKELNLLYNSTEYRLKVHSYLQRHGILFYNNGDPIMFNSISKGIFKGIRHLSERGYLESYGNRDKIIDSLILITQKPIEVLADIQHNFCKKGTILVGGKPHNLVIDAGGNYYSTSGDD